MTETSPDPQRPDTTDPLLALVRRVPAEVQALLAAEVQLATAELRQNVGKLVLAVAIILAGGIMAGVAGIAVLGAIVAALAPLVGPVWSSLITAAAALLIGGALIMLGLSRIRSAPLAPHRAIANLKQHADSINFLKARDTDHER
ncbi:hypothetical protein GCM10007973_26120 [Polymorphobacter multimanifer]|uniref:Phage holin family protein n=1 Tax=Polymorphobacter multimanifer TaxID=1070431 RepID=A0A841L3B4_9SPHN|nr:phage holin family protein [Polymorphobacter multimanifer]MBB6225921.1 hypothetical protein [Polymorphobacter multimanifer]GGI88542.1 hypothetical protein GCM10007973_26120 [Polymorphobacter multimanifer]